MKIQEIEQILRQTLADQKLSGGEKRALTTLLAEIDPDEQTLAVYRNLAFRLAAEQLQDQPSRDVFEWIEDIVKLLYPIRPETTLLESEAYFSPVDDLASRVCRFLDTAKKSLDICVFTITHDQITNAILKAHQRRVAVRIISDNDKSLDLGADIDRLERAGVPVRIDRTEAHMHHKFAISDGVYLLNGSYNWTRSATLYNNENLVLSGESRLVKKFQSYFEKLWRELA